MLLEENKLRLLQIVTHLQSKTSKWTLFIGRYHWSPSPSSLLSWSSPLPLPTLLLLLLLILFYWPPFSDCSVLPSCLDFNIAMVFTITNSTISIIVIVLNMINKGHANFNTIGFWLTCSYRLTFNCFAIEPSCCLYKVPFEVHQVWFEGYSTRKGLFHFKGRFLFKHRQPTAFYARDSYHNYQSFICYLLVDSWSLISMTNVLKPRLNVNTRTLDAKQWWEL